MWELKIREVLSNLPLTETIHAHQISMSFSAFPSFYLSIRLRPCDWIMANRMRVEVMQSLIVPALILHDPSRSFPVGGALEEMYSNSYKLEKGHTIHSDVAWARNELLFYWTAEILWLICYCSIAQPSGMD